jgi:bifunctional oligoribonuclease and PAP phosphatase NrnA
LKTFDHFNEIETVINGSSHISILTHKNPDGDAIGSVLALFHFLSTYKDKETRMIVPDALPDFLKWMPGAEKIMVCEENKEASKQFIEKSDLIVCCDFNHTSRIDCMKNPVLASKGTKFLIDHHPNPEKFADYLFSEPDVSSTAELIYRVIQAFGGRITQEIAYCLFTGIITDTGGFSHNSSDPETYRIVAELLRTGIDKNLIFDKIYSNFTADRMRLMGYCLNEKMKVFPEFKTAFISISKKEMERFNYKTGDTEGFVNLPLSVEGVVFSALFIERADKVKISFRSKGNFAANEFSNAHFNGGGHRNAAGGESYAPLDETVSKFTALLPDYQIKLREQ